MTVRDFSRLSLNCKFNVFARLGVREIGVHRNMADEWFVTIGVNNNVIGTGGTADEAFADAYLLVKEGKCSASNSPAGR